MASEYINESIYFYMSLAIFESVLKESFEGIFVGLGSLRFMTSVYSLSFYAIVWDALFVFASINLQHQESPLLPLLTTTRVFRTLSCSQVFLNSWRGSLAFGYLIPIHSGEFSFSSWLLYRWTSLVQGSSLFSDSLSFSGLRFAIDFLLHHAPQKESFLCDSMNSSTVHSPWSCSAESFRTGFCKGLEWSSDIVLFHFFIDLHR